MLRVTKYSIGPRYDQIHVERTHDIDDTWAIRRFGDVWTRDGQWEYEPMPSSRDDAFLKRARWTEAEGTAEAIRLWSIESDARNAKRATG